MLVNSKKSESDKDLEGVKQLALYIAFTRDGTV